MTPIHIVGRQDHGKTTLIVDLVREFARCGVAVGTIKHSCHAHELDTPGKDSYRHRQAGAVPAAVVAGQMVGVWWPRRAAEDPYARLAPLFADCRLVLVEGDLDRPGIKVEVWRRAVGGPCLAAERSDIQAVVSDDTVEVPVAVWPRGDIAGLARRLLELVERGPPAVP